MTLLRDSTETSRALPTPLSRTLAKVVAVLLVLDSLVIVASMSLAWVFRSQLAPVFGIDGHPQLGLANAWLAAASIGTVWIACLVSRGSYRRHSIGAGFDEFRQVATGTVLALCLVAALSYFSDNPTSRGFLLLTFATGLPLLLTVRYGVRRVVHAMRRRGGMVCRVIAVADRVSLDELLSTLGRTPHLGLQIVGTCIPGRASEAPSDLPVPCYGGVDDVLIACHETGADTVIVAGEGSSTSAALRRLGWALEGSRIELAVVPSLIDVAGPRIRMRHLSGLPLVHIEAPRAGRSGGFAKRLFDIVVASAMLIGAAPLMLLVAIAIKLEDGGPVLFRQTRSGRWGQHFTMTKFRSMSVDAELRLGELLEFNDADEVLFKVKDDPRVTRVGRLIRRLSLDELPQLLDILRGDMSVVGPRPPLPHEVEQYPPDMRRRLLVRPGLTGLWQVSGRSDLPFDEAVRMDLYYVDNWSIMADIIIMLKTVRAVLQARGAY